MTPAGRLAVLVRILRDVPRPGPRDCHHFRGLLSALRTAHPRSERLERRRPTDQARKGLGLNVPRGAAHTVHAHEELPEAVVELLDVSEHPHTRMVRRAETAGPCSTGERSELYGAKIANPEGRPSGTTRAIPTLVRSAAGSA